MVARVLAGRVPSSLDGLLGVKDELLDRELVLRGKFTDEIARLEKARSDAEEKLGMIETVEAAAKVKADADFAAQTTRKEASEMIEHAERLRAAVDSKKRTVDDNEKSVAAREAKLDGIGRNLDAAADALVKREEALTQAGETSARLLAAREAALDKRAAELKAKTALLVEREKRFNARLEGLKLPPE
mgnify:CR=1 FL=1